MRSVNQNRHLYVVKAVGTVNNSAAEGTIEAVVSGDNPKEREIYFKYKGRDGVITRSDFIPVNQVTYAKFVKAEASRTPLRKIQVSLNADALDDDSKPIIGKDYILNISFQQFYGLSPEDTYVKTVGVHVTSSSHEVSDFWDAMIDELNASFSREVGASASENPYLAFTKSGNNLIIEEKEQPWVLGKWEAESLMFDVFPSTIYNEGVEVEWGTATVVTSTSFVPNSKKMADLEWFTYGERADIYRGMGYPNNFDFRPMVDSSNTYGYDALEIHFAYQGSCEDIQKSEKEITIISNSRQELLSGLVTTLEGKTYLNCDITEVPKPSGKP